MQPSVLSQKSAVRARIVAAAGNSAPAQPAGASAGSTSAAVRTAAADAVDRHLCDHYTRRPGIAPLCQAVATHLAALGVPTNENDVVISGSVQEARYVALRALAVGKTVFLLVPEPAIYAAALQFAGATTVIVNDGGDLPSEATGLLLIALSNLPRSPHTLVPVLQGSHDDSAARDQLQRLASWVAANKLTVIADETQAPLGGYTPFAALPAMAQRTLTLGSFAGAAGLGAWQVSWFAGPKQLLTPVRDLKQSITICTSAPSQYAALAALAEHAELTATEEQTSP
jgi:aspartate/methionine/tyrosine aminotransferase